MVRKKDTAGADVGVNGPQKRRGESILRATHTVTKKLQSHTRCPEISDFEKSDVKSDIEFGSLSWKMTLTDGSFVRSSVPMRSGQPSVIWKNLIWSISSLQAF